MTRDLLSLVLVNAAVVAAGHGVLRLAGIRAALTDLPWSIGLAYVAGAAAIGVLGSLLLVLGLSLLWWQILILCVGVLAAGLVRRDDLRSPRPVPVSGWVRLLPAATVVVLAVLAVDLAIQPIWADDAWSIWAIKAISIVELGGLDPAFLSSASVFNADYPLVVPVLELLAYRFYGLPNELVPLQLGLVFLAFPWALVALLRDRVQPVALWTVVLAISLAPSLQIQAASAVADVTLAVFVALAGVAGRRWIEEGETDQLLLLGVFGAAAVGTKVEGGVFVLLLLVALAAAARRRRPLGRSLGRPLGRLAAVAAAIGATAIPWELWSRAHDLGNAFAASGGAGAVDLVAVVDRIPRAVAALTRELADPSSWLALVALSVAALILALRRPAGRELAAFTLFVTLSSLAALVVVYWTTPLGFDYHVATSVRRVVTAPVLFAAAMTPLLLTRAAQQSR